jgi:hypothetical protein
MSGYGPMPTIGLIVPVVRPVRFILSRNRSDGHRVYKSGNVPSAPTRLRQDEISRFTSSQSRNVDDSAKWRPCQKLAGTPEVAVAVGD